jgi:hypothetical protein
VENLPGGFWETNPYFFRGGGGSVTLAIANDLSLAIG